MPARLITAPDAAKLPRLLLLALCVLYVLPGLLGRDPWTIDDAAGEAFDKVARVLGLPFPGGPFIDKAAREGDAAYVSFPRGLTSGRDMARHRFDYSFSGLKTAVARWVEARERDGQPVQAIDPALRPEVKVIDLSGDPEGEAKARAAMRHDMDTPRGLKGEALAAERIYRLGPERHLWYQRVHHLAVDAFGTELITDALPYQLGAETLLEFRGGGVRCVISLPLPPAGGGLGREEEG